MRFIILVFIGCFVCACQESGGRPDTIPEPLEPTAPQPPTEAEYAASQAVIDAHFAVAYANLIQDHEDKEDQITIDMARAGLTGGGLHLGKLIALAGETSKIVFTDFANYALNYSTSGHPVDYQRVIAAMESYRSIFDAYVQGTSAKLCSVAGAPTDCPAQFSAAINTQYNLIVAVLNTRPTGNDSESNQIK